MKESIQRVMTSSRVYEDVIREFFNRGIIRQTCLRGGEPAKKSNIDGLKQLLAVARDKYASEGLTIVMLGGFGSHIGPVRSLDDSAAEWGRFIESQTTPKLRVWQIECSNSFAPEDRCAKEFIDSLAAHEKAEPTPVKHRYLLWGFSKGGNTALEALRVSKDLRDKTLAVVTMGAPLGGSMTMLMLDPLVQNLAKTISGVTGVAAKFANRLPLEYLLTSAAYYVDQDGQPAQIARLLTPTEVNQVSAGSQAMLPLARQEYLNTTVKPADFYRADGTSIPFFQGVALANIADLNAVPLMTLEKGELVWKPDTFISDHMAELGFSIMMKDFPLSDTCVALQHAVLPKNAIPKGLSPELLAVMTFDHASFRFTPLTGVKWEVPHLALVDSLLAAVATKLERAAK
jgi:hypothetical protein